MKPFDQLQVAKLARIAIDEQQDALWLSALKDSKNLIDTLLEVEVLDDVLPLHTPFEHALLVRSDEVKEEGQPANWQALAKKAQSGYYKVPRVIE